MIISIDGDVSTKIISEFVDTMLSRDSIVLRSEIQRISPDIDLTQDVDIEGESVTVAIPMTVNFFWPDT